MYRKVRLACAEGMSQREAARQFNISLDSVRKMMAFSVPPGYRRKAAVKWPKLDAFTGIIDARLDGDRDVHRKQRHTAKRVFERLRAEHGFTGGYTIVKGYVRERERRGREMFVPLAQPRDWRKVHLGIDAEALEIRASEVTGSRIGDAPMLPDLLDQIADDQPIGMVTAPSHGLQANHCRATDGAYDTRACHAAIAARGAAAVIPPRKNGKQWKKQTAGAVVRNDALRSCRRFGRTIWKRWTGYHRRSLIEAKMRCFKLLGERVMARDFNRQVGELQIRAAILNRVTALGTPLTQRVEEV